MMTLAGGSGTLGAMRYQLGQEADDLFFDSGIDDPIFGVMPAGGDPSLVGQAAPVATVDVLPPGVVASSIVGPDVNGNGDGISTVMAVGVGLAVTALLYAWWSFK